LDAGRKEGAMSAIKTSIAAIVLLFASPVFGQTITTQLTNETVVAGAAATFTIGFTGGPCRTDWLVGGSGAFGPYAVSPISFSIPNTTVAMNGETVQVELYGCTGGTASIYSNTVTLTVVPAPTSPMLVSLSIKPPAPTFGTGQTQKFTVTGTFSDGSTENLSRGSGWGSSAPAIASVNGDVTTGVSAGTATITATYGGLSASAVVTINILPFIFTMPGFQTITFPMETAPACVAADGTCSISITACLTSTTPPTCVTIGAGQAGSIVINKTVTLPTPQTVATTVVTSP
jgi:hypothetical protein